MRQKKCGKLTKATKPFTINAEIVKKKKKRKKGKEGVNLDSLLLKFIMIKIRVSFPP